MLGQICIYFGQILLGIVQSTIYPFSLILSRRRTSKSHPKQEFESISSFIEIVNRKPSLAKVYWLNITEGTAVAIVQQMILSQARSP